MILDFCASDLERMAGITVATRFGSEGLKVARRSPSADDARAPTPPPWIPLQVPALSLVVCFLRRTRFVPEEIEVRFDDLIVLHDGEEQRYLSSQ